MLKNFKNKYIKNTLLYKIYRLLKFKPFVSHSSFGEEILVNRLLNNIPKGFFVDVGAFNPKVGSMTYELYKKGWNGINIDFSEENIRLFNFFRKRDISLSKIVSDKNSFLKTYSFDPSSGANTVEKEIADGWSRNFNKKYIINEQESKTLDSILHENKVKKDFDYLNIDVEHHDLKVIMGLNLNLYRPKLITCEIITNSKRLWDKKQRYFSTLEEILNSDINIYLEKYNYKIISHYYLTSFFIPSEFK